ncbi:hypothetical protein [Halorubrum tebenquichense]|uniref:Uncharacterized protein n=1 Tax=Halorubrum tebenquichense DSM 14210 TaxID=1227485 RepID=M0DY38_9EURY|nr:hypothetical protein [Halorubrum tebenquichense]ELZ40411.1 hypothetical protein C472_01843 [Halorubrum tebenquichense DSM 14210]
MGKYGQGIADYELGREYSRNICDQIQTVNNAIQALQSQGCDHLEKVDTIAPGTTPDREDIRQMKQVLDLCVDHLYEEHIEKERIIRHFLTAQQMCIDCLEEVFETEEGN